MSVDPRAGRDAARDKEGNFTLELGARPSTLPYLSSATGSQPPVVWPDSCWSPNPTKALVGGRYCCACVYLAHAGRTCGGVHGTGLGHSGTPLFFSAMLQSSCWWVGGLNLPVCAPKMVHDRFWKNMFLTHFQPILPLKVAHFQGFIGLLMGGTGSKRAQNGLISHTLCIPSGPGSILEKPILTHFGPTFGPKIAYFQGI